MEDDVNHKDIDDEEDLLDTENELEMTARVKKLESNLVFIMHQLTSIMTHLHVKGCECTTCIHVKQNGVAKKENSASSMLSQLFPNASAQQLKTLMDLSEQNKLPSQIIHQKDHQTGAATPKIEPENLKLGQNYQGNGNGGKIHTERHSEPGRKLKKLGFPAPVAAYYQRKESAHIPPTPLSSIPNLITTTATSTVSANTSTASPGPSSSEGSGDDHNDNQIDTVVVPVQSSTVPATPTTTPGANLFTQSMVDMIKLNAAAQQQNAAHSTGSPGFLRGRGRGRPKLIGDELDADLVDYMVQLKNADPHGGHFTASQALHMARQYILERAPGLLEEHGGHVKLKLTWAMKLVSRIGERQKEIELGLPAGTLSNMGRNLTNLNPPGNNFMADMMAQNLFSQQLMMMGGGGGSPKHGKTEKNQNEENLKMDVSQMPEIVNIKELNLPFLNNFLAELNDNNSGLVDGEVASSAAAAAIFAPHA